MLCNVGFIFFIFCYRGQACLICVIQIVINEQQQKTLLIKSQTFTNQPMKCVFNGKFAKPFVQTSHFYCQKWISKYCACWAVSPSILLISPMLFYKVWKTKLFFLTALKYYRIRFSLIEFCSDREDWDYRNTRNSINCHQEKKWNRRQKGLNKITSTKAKPVGKFGLHSKTIQEEKRDRLNHVCRFSSTKHLPQSRAHTPW